MMIPCPSPATADAINANIAAHMPNALIRLFILIPPTARQLLAELFDLKRRLRPSRGNPAWEVKIESLLPYLLHRSCKGFTNILAARTFAGECARRTARTGRLFGL